MRRQIVQVAIVAVSVALILFGLPLAAAARALILTQERGELERVALLAAGQVGPDFAAGDPVELPTVAADKQVAVYDASLRLRSGHGPTTADEITNAAVTGRQADGQVDSDLVVAVPVTVSENVVGVVRAATPMRLVWEWILLSWAVLVVLAIAALAIAFLVARRQARLLSQPLEALSAAAERVGAGDLQIRAPLTGGSELARLAQTQNAMLDRLTDLLARERRFSADVSHQLRTPLTGLQLGLENAAEIARDHPGADLGPAVLESADRVRDLGRTIENILRLARPDADRDVTASPRPVSHVLGDLERHWHGPLATLGRQLVVHADAVDGDAQIPGFVATEVLTVLLDNAVKHGQGRVEVTVRDLADVIAIDVSDEGNITVASEDLFRRGSSSGGGSGIGLSLARSIADAAGGRLLLAAAAPARFTLLMPRPDDRK